MLNGRFLAVCVLAVLGFASTSIAIPAGAPQISSELSGVVHDEQGHPLVGAVVSVFGRNLTQGARVAVTDEEGRFEVVDVPPGLYRLRAYLEGFLPSDYAKVLVEAGVETASSILMSLASASEDATADADVEAEPGRTTAELQWLLRHGERNILKDTDDTVSVASLDLGPAKAPESGIFADVGGEFGVMAGAAGRDIDEFPAAGAGLDARLAFAHLTIPTKRDGYWLVSAQLLESALSSWAGRAEFVNGAVSGHEISTGVAYGNYLYGDVEGFRPPEAGLVGRQGGVGATEWFGSIFARDTFSVGDARVSAGLDYRHFSYLSRAGYASPSVAVSFPADAESKTTLLGEMSYQLQAPGGEDMSLLSEMVYHDVYGPSLPQQRDLRAERTARFQVGLEQRLGETTSMLVRVFQENATDQLVRVYSKNLPVNGGAGYYSMGNQGDFQTRGLGLSFSQRFGATEGTVGYNYGTARTLNPTLPGALARDNEIHDVTTRVSTSIDRTRTRVRAAYRLTRHPMLAKGRPGFTAESGIDSRFDIQVYQMLPFVGWNGTRWELMVAVRSLFYEDTDGVSLLDEMSVVDAPKRVLGGVSVRF